MTPTSSTPTAQSAATPTVRYEVSDAVATVTLCAPSTRNALTFDMRDQLLTHLREASQDAAVRCVVLTGEGPGFCAGQDLREHVESMNAPEPTHINTVTEHYNPLALTIAEMPKPVIASLNGVTAGAGLSLAMAADFRIAADTVKFTTAFAGIALSCDTGASWTLQRLVGLARAKELLFDPTPIDAARAEEIGLVNRVVPAKELVPATRAWALRLAQGPTLAYAALKESLDYAATHSFAEALEYEEPRMVRTGASADHRAAVEAFLAKTTPTFEGR